MVNTKMGTPERSGLNDDKNLNVELRDDADNFEPNLNVPGDYEGYELLSLNDADQNVHYHGDNSSNSDNSDDEDHQPEIDGISYEDIEGHQSGSNFPNNTSPEGLTLAEADSKTKDIELGESKIVEVKEAMRNFTLPAEHIPEWASRIPEEKWKEFVIKKMSKDC